MWFHISILTVLWLAAPMNTPVDRFFQCLLPDPSRGSLNLLQSQQGYVSVCPDGRHPNEIPTSSLIRLSMPISTWSRSNSSFSLRPFQITELQEWQRPAALQINLISVDCVLSFIPSFGNQSWVTISEGQHEVWQQKLIRNQHYFSAQLTL